MCTFIYWIWINNLRMYISTVIISIAYTYILYLYACSTSTHGPSTSCTHAVLTWSVEVQVTGLLFICVTCTGKAVVDTIMDWLEVEELQLDKLLGGWRGCLCQCCVHQVPITDHHPVLVEGHGEDITRVSEATADVEGSSSVEVVAELWVSEGIVVWLCSRRWSQPRYQSEACHWQGWWRQCTYR